MSRPIMPTWPLCQCYPIHPSSRALSLASFHVVALCPTFSKKKSRRSKGPHRDSKEVNKGIFATPKIASYG